MSRAVGSERRVDLNGRGRFFADSGSAKPIFGWRHPLVWLRWGSLVVPLVVLVVAALLAFRQERAQTEALALQHAELVSQYTLRLVETHSAVLDRIGDLTALVDPAASGPAAYDFLQERFSAFVAQSGYVHSLGVLSWDGTILAASRPEIIGRDVSDRDYFRALTEDPTLLYLDRVRLIADDTDAVVIARAVEGPGFSGVAVSTIRVEALTDFFARVAGPGETPGLLREDGKMIVRALADRPPVVLGPDTPAMQAVAQAREGIFEMVALSDGVRRIYAHTRIDTLPIIATYGVEMEVVWERWRARMWMGALALVAIGLSGFVVSGQAIRRIAAEEAARQAAFDRSLLEEARKTATFRETLLREMHHRIRNNLHQVQALARAHMRSGAIDAKALEDRIWAIAEVHELLYASGTVARLDLADLARAICANPAIVPPERGIHVDCAVETIEIGIEQGTPLALILVEIMTNAVKHAFPEGRNGTIRVRLRREGGAAVLEIAEDGIGLPPASERGRHSGLRLIDGLVRQIGGEIAVTALGGTAYTIRVPLPPAQAA